jgi:nucleotide-binding universal stress UspA family protein
MKSFLLYANDDEGLAARLEAGVHLATTFDARLSCVHVTPYDAFITGDPFGGIYALPTLVEHGDEVEAEHHRQLEKRMEGKDVRWAWFHYQGHPGHVLLERSRLADLVIVSLPGKTGARQRLSLAADLAIHARTPTLALPPNGNAFDSRGVAVVAWNGSPESAHTLRLALPLLRAARSVQLITISDDRVSLPAAEAGVYLSDHGIAWSAHDQQRSKRNVADALIEMTLHLGGDYLLAGAYGHSRIRERVLGGVTHDLISRSPLPLLLAH